MKKEESATRKLTLSGVLSWIFGILFGLGGLGSIAQGSISFGIVAVLIALVILPPANRFYKEKFNFELSRNLKILIVVILMVVASSVTPYSDLSSSTPSSQNVASNVNVAAKVYNTGETFTVGDFAYTFNRITMPTSVGSGFLEKSADGLFVVIDVTVENLSKEPRYWDSYVTIVDDKDRTYERDTSAEVYLGNEALIFENLQPGLPKRGIIIFDVPTNLKGAIKVTSNIFSGDTAYVSFQK